MSPASRASSIAKSRYSIKSGGLPRSVRRSELCDTVHDLDESFLLSKSSKCGFGLDLVEFFEPFIERPVEVGDGKIFVSAGGVESSEIKTDGGITSAGCLDERAES